MTFAYSQLNSNKSCRQIKICYFLEACSLNFQRVKVTHDASAEKCLFKGKVIW